MEIAHRLGVSTEELTGETSPQQRPRSLELLDAMVLGRMGRLEESEELLRGVLREAEVNGDGERMSEACEGLGVLAAARGDDREARRLLEQALEVGTRPTRPSGCSSTAVCRRSTAARATSPGRSRCSRTASPGSAATASRTRRSSFATRSG